MADSAEEVRKHLKLYFTIGGILLFCTVLTVWVGLSPMWDLGAPGVTGEDIIVGLAIAAFKTSLVVLVFMHMNNERALIYKFMLFTVVFAAGLFALTYLAHIDPIYWPAFNNIEYFGGGE